MRSVKTKAPGKLYIAGEYAVVEPGYSAIITAIDLFVYVSLSKAASDIGSIFSKGYTETPVKWTRENNVATVSNNKHQLDYVLSAIRVTEAYLAENDVTLVHHDLKIDSELDHIGGHKYGLGSSGAVTVATIHALLQFYNVEFSDLLIYKLSVLAQMDVGVNSSFGDLAAIIYGGWIQYTSFDRDYVKQLRKIRTVSETIEAYWSKLMIKKMRVSNKIDFLVGWTGSPASSDDLVGTVQENKEQTTEQYENFLEESQASVTLLAIGLEENNRFKIKDAVDRNRQALKQMGQETNVTIETPMLSKLCDIANKHGGAAKTSGAGGGDSGIAFVFRKDQANKIISDWAKADIEHLNLSIHK